jgi:hypothetical protein
MDQKQSKALEEVFEELNTLADEFDKKRLMARKTKKQQPPEAEKKE